MLKRTPNRDKIVSGGRGHGGQGRVVVCFRGHQIGTDLCQRTGARPGRGGVVCFRGHQIGTEVCQRTGATPGRGGLSCD